MENEYPNEQDAMNNFFTFLDAIIDAGKLELNELEQQAAGSCQEKKILAKKATYLDDFYKDVRREFTDRGIPTRSQKELQGYLDNKLRSLEYDIIDILNRKNAEAIEVEDNIQLRANFSLADCKMKLNT